MSMHEKTRKVFESGRRHETKECEVCGRTFKRISALILHKRVHAVKRPYHCIYCKIDFKNLSRYKGHMSSEHGIWKDQDNVKHGNHNNKRPDQNIPQPTTNCGDNADEQENSTHRSSSFKKSVLKCAICPSTYRRRGAFRNHMRLHEIQQKVSLNDLNHHINKKVDDDTLKGDNTLTVNKTKKGQLQISTHIEQFHLKERANESEENISDLINSNKAPDKLDNYLISQQSLSKLYKCFRCKETFNSNAEIECHACKTTSRSSIKCRKCNRYFKSLVTLKHHDTLKHSNPNEERILYVCPYCEKAFSFRGSRDRHVKTIHNNLEHTNSKNIPLKTRKRSLPVSQQNACPVCKIVLKSKSSRDRHVKVMHQNLIKSFSLSELLNIQRGPDAGGQYRCSYCNKTFRKEYTRDQHVKIVHKDYGQNSSVYKCTQCNSTFTKEYMLCKHVMKVHWKEDNRLNRMKQTTEDNTKVNNEITDTNNVTESQNCENEDNGAATAGKIEHKLHSNTQHVDKVSKLNIHSDIKNKDQCQIINQSSVTSVHNNNNTRSGRAIGQKRKILNEEILLEYRVATEMFEPCQLDPSSNKMVHTCSLCKTTYTKTPNFIRHIKNRAYDHGKYLKLRKKCKFKLSDGDKPEKTITNHDHLSLNERQPPQLTYRFECDVCLNKFTRRFNMISHRQTHTKDEFKKVGAREDVYKSPDGKTIINLDNYFEPANTEYESTIAKLHINEQSSAAENGRPAIYLDMAYDGNFNPYKDVVLDGHDLVSEETTFQIHNSTCLARENNLNTDDESKVLEDSGDSSFTFNTQNAVSNTTIPLLNKTSQTRPAVNFSNLNQNTTVEEKQSMNNNVSSEINGNKSILYISGFQEETLNELPNTARSIQKCNLQENTEDVVVAKSYDFHKFQHGKEQTEIPNEIPVTDEILQTNQHENGSTNIQNNSASINENAPMIQEEILNELPSTTGNIPFVQMENRRVDYMNEIPIIQTQALNNSTQLKDTTSSSAARKICITCGLSLQNGHVCCKLCDQMFCIRCSDIPKDIYDILFCSGADWPSGVMWTCSICKHLLPKFTVLLSQLGNFEQIIDNRLTDMEQKLSKIGKQ